MEKGSIQLKNVSKSYKIYPHLKGGVKNFVVNPHKVFRIKEIFNALNEINLEIKPGESVGVIGKNGAGKSTLLSIISGVDKPSFGEVITSGRVIPMLELGAGLHPDLTGRENILLKGVLLGLKRKEVYQLMDKIIEFSELEKFIDEPIRVYSSGMLSRLGFSIVSHIESDILLIDEILAVGDKDFQKKCLDRMKYVKNKGVTILLVSHDMNHIEFLCDRVIWIKDHTVFMDGNTKDVVLRYLEEL